MAYWKQQPDVPLTGRYAEYADYFASDQGVTALLDWMRRHYASPHARHGDDDDHASAVSGSGAR
jgi:hypothetical protein